MELEAGGVDVDSPVGTAGGIDVIRVACAPGGFNPALGRSATARLPRIRAAMARSIQMTITRTVVIAMADRCMKHDYNKTERSLPMKTWC